MEIEPLVLPVVVVVLASGMPLLATVPSSRMQSSWTGLAECSAAFPVSLLASLPAFGCALPDWPAVRSVHFGSAEVVEAVVLPTVGPVVVLVAGAVVVPPDVPVVAPAVERGVRAVLVDDGLLDEVLMLLCCFVVSLLPLVVCATAGSARAAASARVLMN